MFQKLTGQAIPLQKTVPAIIGLLIVAGLYASSLYGYLLFHSLVELFCILVAFVIFVLAWHTRSIQDNQYLLFIGIASLFVGAIELLHAFAYKGMGIFSGYSADLPTQLWITFRYLFSLSFLAAPFFIRGKLHAGKTFATYLVVTIVLVVSIFSGRFPSCFVEGSGLTPFKIYSEYVISLIFLAALGLLIMNRGSFDHSVLRLMAGALLASMASELSFTRYVSVYGMSNMVGHFFLLASMALIYRALVITGIVEPSSLLFRDLKKSEEAIAQLNSALKQNVLQLEAANKELESFAYSVSHDLRAPLRAIDGFSHAIEEEHGEKLGEAGRDNIRRVRAGVRNMGRLIEALLNLSQLSRCELNCVNFDLSELVRNKAGELMRAEPGRFVEFVAAPGITVHGDPLMLGAAIENLLGNAWKFTSKTPHAKIEFGACSLRNADCGMRNVKSEIRNASTSLSIVSMSNDLQSEIVYFVRDNGAGFDTTYASKLFSPFQRLHSSQDFPGMGIGLATVGRIIHRHGGNIWAEGTVGQGATFFFTV